MEHRVGRTHGAKQARSRRCHALAEREEAKSTGASSAPRVPEKSVLEATRQDEESECGMVHARSTDRASISKTMTHKTCAKRMKNTPRSSVLV